MIDERTPMQRFNFYVELFDKMTHGLFDRVSDVNRIHRMANDFVGKGFGENFALAARGAGYEISVNHQTKENL